MSGIATLKYCGLFLPRDGSAPLVVFDNTWAVKSEPDEIHYTQAALEEAAENYAKQGNQLQAEEMRAGLKALAEFRNNYAYNH